MNKRTTQKMIFTIKDRLEDNLKRFMNLQRVTVPMVVDLESGLNDGLEWDDSKTPVQFESNGKTIQVVQAATKWKRTALEALDMKPGEGIVTDMRAIRKNETMDALHSIYVDQWDWERVITSDNRNLGFLQDTVNRIWMSIKDAEVHLKLLFPDEELPVLPEKVHFISAEDLYRKYPIDDPRKRELAILKEHPAVFIYAIGHKLPDGSRHELRAADYDDWTLNGDLVVLNTVTGQPHELSSMGIRVDAKALVEQLKVTDQLEMLAFDYHQGIVDERLPLTIGGGIGQSRLFMLLLGKRHIREVQESVWNDDQS
jgi:aspartate--ammonia ligase